MRKSGFVTLADFDAHKDKHWQTVHGIWANIRGITIVPGARGSGPDHTHVMAHITDTPWVWADVSKAGSNLTDLATRQHAGLTDITSDQHHAESHTLASHSTKPHSALTDVLENQHHNKVHALTGTHHTASGLTVGWVIKATGATTFAWGQLPHDKLAGLGDDDHSQYHNDARGDARYYTKTQLQTSGQAQVHWANITNTPTTYPPEYHYHVGKDIISLHLVDLGDVEADDIFDVLSTGNIHGQGTYDWFGTWVTTAAASTSATIVVLAGDDKYLRLTDNNAGDDVDTKLTASTGHPMVTGVIEFQVRISEKKTAYLDLMKGATRSMGFEIYDGGVGDRKFWFWNGTAEVELLSSYNVNQWYKIRIHFDCVARAAVIFVENVFKVRTTLSALTICDYVNVIRARTDPLSTGYTFDINNLKVFNLTI